MDKKLRLAYTGTCAVFKLHGGRGVSQLPEFTPARAGRGGLPTCFAMQAEASPGASTDL